LEDNLILLDFLNWQGSGEPENPVELPGEPEDSDSGNESEVESESDASGGSGWLSLPQLKLPVIQIPELSSVKVLHPIFPYPYQDLNVFDLALMGADLPKPQSAPYVYLKSRSSDATVAMVEVLKTQGIIEERKDIKCAFRLTVIPKPTGKPRVILDLSPWTEHYTKPRFSLLDAAKALRHLGPGVKMAKIDLRDAFHQIQIRKQHQNLYGIALNDKKYCFVRLPMGHTLAPAIMQRFSRAVATEIRDRFQIQLIPYLDDWLFTGPELTREVTNEIVRFLVYELGITINYGKSKLNPVTRLEYLGTEIDTSVMTIRLLPTTIARLHLVICIIKRLKSTELPKAAGFISWCVYVLGLPRFLISDVYRRETRWLKDLYEEGVFQQERSFDLRTIKELAIYTDATPWQGAVVIPSMGREFIHQFEEETAIYHAEGFMAVLGPYLLLQKKLVNVNFKIIVYCDNQAAVFALSKGRGLLFENENVKLMYINIIKELPHGVAWIFVPGRLNPADRPSRTVPS